MVRDAVGSYAVSIGDRSGVFFVDAPPPPATPTTETPFPMQIGWGILAIAGGALFVIIVLMLYLLVFRRRRSYRGYIR